MKPGPGNQIFRGLEKEKITVVHTVKKLLPCDFTVENYFLPRDFLVTKKLMPLDFPDENK